MNLQDRANQCIAQGALTNSKRPSTFVQGVYPTHLHRGKACYTWDYSGKKYVDFITGLGSSILGYSHDVVNAAIMKRLEEGSSLSLGTALEVDLAEKLKTLFPFIETLRFLKTGTEGCMAAIKIARAFQGLSADTQKTSRRLILSDGYHGHSDEFISLSKPALGIPIKADILPLTGNESLIAKAAAVIIEPIITDISDQRIKWLKDLRKTCSDAGTVLIFDEVITGFRFPDYSVSNHYGIYPDLIVMGKALANGMPLSVVGGKRAIMECGEYFVSSTFAGETLSLASALKTLELLQSRYLLKDLWGIGEAWLKEFNSFWPEKITIQGYPTRGRFDGDEDVKALFFQEACEAGILFGPSWFFNFPLSEKKEILGILKDILCRIKQGSVKLKGKKPQSPFAEQMRKKG